MKGLYVAVCLVVGLAGPIDRVAAAAGILCGLVWWVWGAAASGPPAGGHSFDARSLRWLPILAGLPLLLRLQDVETRLALLVCMTLATFTRAGGTAALFAAAVLGWRLLMQGVPWLWIVEVQASRVVSRCVGLATGQRIDLGPSASGIELLIVFVLGFAAAGATPGVRRSRRFLAATALACLFIAALPGLGKLAPGLLLGASGLLNQAREHLAPTPQAVARVMFGWSAALLAAFCLMLPAEAGLRPAPRGGRAGAAFLLIILVASLAVLQAPRPQRRQGEILMAGRGAFNMDVPAAGRYGAAQAGMFGLLPRYLGMDGHRVRRHEGPIDQETLSRAAVVIVALPLAPLAPQEREALVSWVGSGGSLVVLGDHTDLLGTMRPANDLIGAWGVELQFDSAFASVREWAGCLDAARPGLRAATGIGTGASLRIGAGVRPLIVGRYGLADGGDRSNAGAGAFLGNYAYDPGEQLGDIVLAAETQVARGRVVVFGDTSSFQNLMLSSSYPFVASLFDDLSRPPPSIAGSADLARAAGVASALAAAALGALALGGSAVAAAGLAVATLGFAAWDSATVAPGPLERLPAGARVALLDASHLNHYERELWHEGSIGGLIVSLEREGFLPLVMEDGFERSIPGVDALAVLIAPRRALSSSQAVALSSHVERGGDVLVSAGADERGAVAPLLSLYGLTMGQLPLGPVPIVADMDRPAWEAQRRLAQFRRACPLLSDGASRIRGVQRAYGYDIVVEARSRAGDGRLLVIADPDFLTDRVLENEHGAWEGNVDLLDSLLNRPPS